MRSSMLMLVLVSEKIYLYNVSLKTLLCNGKIRRKKINAAHDASLVERHMHFDFIISLDSFTGLRVSLF